MTVEVDIPQGKPKPGPEEHRVEDILEKLGGYSWFQFWATAVIILPEIPASMIAMSPVLTGSSKLAYACQTEDGLFNLTSDSLCTFPNCTGKVVPVQSRFTSIVQEWSLFCDRAWMVDMATSVQMFGSMLGAIVCAKLADKFGRRRLFFLLCFIMGTFGAGSSWAKDVGTFGMTRLVAGFAVGGMYVVYVNYLMEFLTPSYRTICGCVSLWSLGEMLLALLGYFVPQWRELSLITAVPVLLILAAYRWLPESPRWLLCQGQTEEACKVFNRIAACNGRDDVDSAEVEKVQAQITTENNKKLTNNVGLRAVFRNRPYRNQLLICMWAWFSVSVVYYGLGFNTKHLSGNPYLNVFYLGLSDLPGGFSGIYFNNRFGRKRTFMGFISLGSILLLVLSALEFGESAELELDLSVRTFLSLFGRYCISASWGIMTCFTAESFPTVSRASCMGLCAFAGNIGGILSPQLVFLGTKWRAVPYLVFGLLSITTTLVSLGLQEMTGKPLADSIPTKNLPDSFGKSNR